jgi:ribosomal peptide maturation radical SAM protein 1
VTQRPLPWSARRRDSPAQARLDTEQAQGRPDKARAGLDAAWPVVLVSMPFMDASRPSIQLGLLKALAAAHGFPARTLHANLDFAARIGVDYYQLLSQHRGQLIGEWLFSLEAFPGDAPDPNAHMLDEFARHLSYLAGPGESPRERMTRTRQDDVPRYLDALMDSFPWAEVAVAGFTSTFQQNTASIALARRLKQRYPHIVTLFGGANFDGEMGLELMRTVECIDAAVIGEGDDAFPGFLSALATGADPGLVPGVAWRADGHVTMTPASPPVKSLDDLPAPDYEEYFTRAEQLGVLRAGDRAVWLPIETSRGCWWGAKHHCTFCGLNATAMRFRSKSPERVLSELAKQARTYRSRHFEAVDNILDPAYLRQLFPALVESDAGYTFFYEVKANLGRAQLRLLAQAGVTRIQPGLESLSSHVLELMRKGVRAVQNVNLLRWARYYEIDVAWNLIWGIPGETERDYAEQAAAIPQLLHLPPPSSAGPIWLERFSPLFSGQDGPAIRDRAPERSYRYVYPEEVDLERVAYFFDYQPEGTVPESCYAQVRQAAADWTGAWRPREGRPGPGQESHSGPGASGPGASGPGWPGASGPGWPPLLTCWSAPHFVQISDRRQPAGAGTYTFEDTLADLYAACINRPTTAVAVRRQLGLDLPVEAVQEIFNEFSRRGLMFLDGQFAVALALPSVKGR